MTSFPSATDLETALQRLGVLTGSLPSALTNVTDAAVQQWLHDTNIRYWLATDRTDRFPIEQGLIIPHSPIITITSITVDDTLLIENDDYVLHPVNASPARYLVFNRWQGNAMIEAKFGWSLTDPVPAAVWYAVLDLSCRIAINQLSMQSPGSVTRIRQGEVDISYMDTQTWNDAVTQRYNQVVNQYRLQRFL